MIVHNTELYEKVDLKTHPEERIFEFFPTGKERRTIDAVMVATRKGLPGYVFFLGFDTVAYATDYCDIPGAYGDSIVALYDLATSGKANPDFLEERVPPMPLDQLLPWLMQTGPGGYEGRDEFGRILITERMESVLPEQAILGLMEISRRAGELLT